MSHLRKIKVLHVVTRMNTGGVAILLDNLLGQIDDRLFETTLLVGECQAHEEDFLINHKNTYQVIRIPGLQRQFNALADVRAFIELFRLFRRIKPDIIHSHTSKAGALGRVAGRLAVPNAVLIHTFHGHLLIGYFNKTKKVAITCIEKFLSFITDSLIAMGTQVKAELIAAGIGSDSKFKTILPGVHLGAYPTKSDAREIIGLEKEAIYCLFVGRLTRIKRPERLLELAEELQDKNQNIHFLIIGDGELRESLQSKVAERNLRVHFLGWRSDIPIILKASDLAILLSDNEAVPLFLIESAQAGLPIVTTDVGSVRDVVVNGENGFVLDYNVEDFATKIFDLVQSKELRQSMGSQGIQITKEKFSVKKMVTEHQNLYQKLLEKRLIDLSAPTDV